MQAPPAEPDQTIEPIDVYSGERMMGNMMTINHRSVDAHLPSVPPHGGFACSLDACLATVAVGW